ncbi:MAG TPA: TylF/MycF/NovP-related O-methyltransferase, partial [Armatimonadota bacterium]|nr:TylF/MycF/NovP-related O-methyltransferase [Armatimonadota bacterium]
LERLSNIQSCVTQALRDRVPGDLIEAGVWRGGAAIFMRGILAAYGERERRVWVADSFEGLPRPNPDRYPADRDDPHWTMKEQLGVSLEEVRENFARYGLLDEQVRFLKGWFSETLPGAPVERLAVMRLDGDMYESTMDALRALYPRLSPGGYVIVDDYYYLEGCRAAVEDYRREHGITEPVQPADWNAAFWRRS